MTFTRIAAPTRIAATALVTAALALGALGLGSPELASARGGDNAVPVEDRRETDGDGSAADQPTGDQPADDPAGVPGTGPDAQPEPDPVDDPGTGPDNGSPRDSDDHEPRDDDPRTDEPKPTQFEPVDDPRDSVSEPQPMTPEPVIVAGRPLPPPADEQLAPAPEPAAEPMRHIDILVDLGVLERGGGASVVELDRFISPHCTLFPFAHLVYPGCVEPASKDSLTTSEQVDEAPVPTWKGIKIPYICEVNFETGSVTYCTYIVWKPTIPVDPRNL
jgi:hypothetical protein